MTVETSTGLYIYLNSGELQEQNGNVPIYGLCNPNSQCSHMSDHAM